MEYLIGRERENEYRLEEKEKEYLIGREKENEYRLEEKEEEYLIEREEGKGMFERKRKRTRIT